MKTKTCTKCGMEKELDAFHIHSNKIRRSACKECFRASERIRDRARENGRKTEHRAQTARVRARRNYKKVGTLRYDAMIAVRNALKTGKLTPEPCKVCRATKTDAHHEDYNKPLDIVWLCRSHHKLRHIEINRTSVP